MENMVCREAGVSNGKELEAKESVVGMENMVCREAGVSNGKEPKGKESVVAMENVVCREAGVSSGKEPKGKESIVRRENMVCREAGVSNGKELEGKESVIDFQNWPGCCIYRVPRKLREVNERAYTPKIVSIGPFHHGREELKGFEKQKQKYLEEFCLRTGKGAEFLVSIIRKEEEEVRHCYSVTVEPDPEKFVRMLLLDATFIIELFLRYDKGETFEKTDYILYNPWLKFHLKQDLILLENQIPYKFLQKFYRSAYDIQDDEDSQFLALTCRFFFQYDFQISRGRRKEPFPVSQIARYREVEHFTDMQRTRFRPTDRSRRKPAGYLRYTATKLDEAGVEFEGVELDWSKISLLDIDFAKNKCLECYPCLNFSWLFACLPCFKWCSYFKCVQCILKIPKLVVDDQTETLFRNMMALEQCHYPLETHICNYVTLLYSLINTDEDVGLLAEKKVIVNRLSSISAVTTLTNKLGQEIVEVNNCYFDLHERLIEHCDSPWNSLVASLRSVYFRDFWRGTATIAGIMILCLAFGNFLRAFVIKV